MQIVYVLTAFETSDRSRADDVYVYDVRTDRVSRLTKDGDRVVESLPRFHGTKVTFISGRHDLIEFDPVTKVSRRMLRVSGVLLTYAWSPDHSEIAYIEVLESGAHRLRVRNATTGRTMTLKQLGSVEGRGSEDLDASSIAWSRRGDKLLVNATHLTGAPRVRLMRRRDGRDLITPLRDATNALWSADERSVYVLFASVDGGGDNSWRSLDVASGRFRRLALQPRAFHGALSPDGTRLAAVVYDRPRKIHDVFVLDLRTNRQTGLARGYRDPVWLDAGTLALTRVVACSTRGDCEYYGYRPTGTRRITLTGEVSRMALGSTLWSGLGMPNLDVRYV